MSEKREKNNSTSSASGVQFSTQKSYVDLKSIKKKFFVSKAKQEKNEIELEREESLLEQIDVPPNANNYRNLLSVNYQVTEKARPSLQELQNNLHKKSKNNKDDTSNIESNSEKKSQNIIKFGWIKGVLIRCTLNIFGVMIFLRISWVVGQCGIGLATIVVILAGVVTMITTLSTSAICTNGDVKGGGAYFLISRSLGPEFGGAIGIVFAFANAVGAAMYVIGFAETLTTLLKENGLSLIDAAVNDTRVYGLLTNIILLIIALIGMTWEAKIQLFLLGILATAMINFLIGSFLPGSEVKQARGFVGYDFELFKENFQPDFRDGESFTSVFGVFFPAVTGILAGANISGNLKNPQMAIPKGTMLSIVLTSIIYILFCWICGATMAREATGVWSISNNTKEYLDCSNTTCEYGLLNSYQVMELVSEIPYFLKGQNPIIIAGIFSASLSSGLASLVGAPKIFQAVCQDKIFPKIKYFAVGHGKDNEPWRGYFLTFFISSAFIAIGDLNAIAPIISNFFLLSYALINFACFDATISKAPGWRPSFKYYNKWVSLFGAFICIIIMFLIEWWAALVSFLVCSVLYSYIKHRKPKINWGSSGQAHIYRRSLEYSLKLMHTDEHVKNFRPNFLVLTGQPSKRPALCDLCAELTKGNSLMVCANIIHQSQGLREFDNFSKYYEWMEKRHIKSFYTEVNAETMRGGAVSLIQSVGLGKLRPNTLIMGFKNNWQTDSIDSVLDYYGIINDAFDMKFGICLLKLDGGLDYSDLFDDKYNENDETISYESNSDSDLEDMVETNINDSMIKMRNIEKLIQKKNKSNWNSINKDKNNNMSKITENNDNNVKNSNNITREKKHSIGSINFQTNPEIFINGVAPKSTDLIKLKNTKINQGLLQGLNKFYRKEQKGFVDVWWLYDDGGLTLLLPYLLLQRKHWNKCKLRIFIQTKNSDSEISQEQRNMATLLSRFRIKFHDIIVFSLNKCIESSNLAEYENSIHKWRLKPNETIEQFPWKITDSMYKQNTDNIYNNLRLRNLLEEYSQDSSLIVITIMVPNKVNTCAALFMSRLDYLSKGMPPILMIRGNQSPVLTFYS